MYLLSMKIVNLVFSILFIYWCIVHLNASKSEASDYHKRLGYDFEKTELSTFWTFVIVLTSFNFFGYFSNHFNFYLFGAAGMILLCILQFIFVLISFNVKMSEFQQKELKYQFENRFGFLLVTFPYIFFGIQSSLYCYHQKLNEKSEQYRSKFQSFCLQFCVTDYEKIYLFFNIIISSCMFVLFILMVKDSNKFDADAFFILAPFIPTFFNILAFSLKEKKYYMGTIFCWGIMAAFFIYICFASFKNASSQKIHDSLSFGFVRMINTIVGCFSALSIYFQKERKIENSFENPNYVSYVVAEDGVVM